MSSKTSNLLVLAREACDSYAMYLTYSGVLDTHEAKLSLLKWPDVAMAAIESLENDQADLRSLINDDLNIIIYTPIRIIFESFRARLNGLGIDWDDVANKADDVRKANPIAAKRLLLPEINKMAAHLNRLTST